MNRHTFVFTPGIWLGIGKLSFNFSPNKIKFYMKWIISPISQENVIQCEQIIEAEGSDESIINEYRLMPTSLNSFDIQLRSNILGIVNGKGIIDGETINWEYTTPVPFEDTSGFSGEEVYTLQSNGEYLFKGEFRTNGDSSTLIEGKIWKKE